jgi:hypothetical protein
MIASALAIVFFLLPAAAWIGNGRLWTKRLRILPLFATTSLVGYVLLLGMVQIANLELRHALNRHDLNGDGEFDAGEQTPAMKRAMDNLTTDTGRSLVPVTGVPTTLIVYGFQFAIFGIIRAGRRKHGRSETDR